MSAAPAECQTTNLDHFKEIVDEFDTQLKNSQQSHQDEKSLLELQTQKLLKLQKLLEQIEKSGRERPTAEDLLASALIHEQLDHPRETLILAKKCVERAPKLVDAYLPLIRQQMRFGLISEASKSLQTAIDMDEDDAAGIEKLHLPLFIFSSFNDEPEIQKKHLILGAKFASTNSTKSPELAKQAIFFAKEVTLAKKLLLPASEHEALCTEFRTNIEKNLSQIWPPAENMPTDPRVFFQLKLLSEVEESPEKLSSLCITWLNATAKLTQRSKHPEACMLASQSLYEISNRLIYLGSGTEYKDSVASALDALAENKICHELNLEAEAFAETFKNHQDLLKTLRLTSLNTCGDHPDVKHVLIWVRDVVSMQNWIDATKLSISRFQKTEEHPAYSILEQVFRSAIPQPIANPRPERTYFLSVSSLENGVLTCSILDLGGEIESVLREKVHSSSPPDTAVLLFNSVGELKHLGIGLSQINCDAITNWLRL
tara:strand:- start:687 stop:2144 length:1458 start_codon:yes stop_codon:yes gene_type:complete